MTPVEQATDLISTLVTDLGSGIFTALETALPFVIAIAVFFFAWRMIMRRV